MVGYTPQDRIALLYIALAMGILALALIVTVIVVARRGVARGRMRVPPAAFAGLVGIGCVVGGTAAEAGVRLLGIRAGVDTTNLALAIQFASIGVAYLILGALGVMWLRRRRARGREGQR
jgi:hypothetical protein